MQTSVNNLLSFLLRNNRVY